LFERAGKFRSQLKIIRNTNDGGSRGLFIGGFREMFYSCLKFNDVPCFFFTLTAGENSILFDTLLIFFRGFGLFVLIFLEVSFSAIQISSAVDCERFPYNQFAK